MSRRIQILPDAVANQIADYLVNGTITNAVNVPSVSGEVLPKVQPYLELAEKLGSLTSQLAEFAPQTVQIRYAGSVRDLPSEPMTISVLKGVMEPVMGVGAVNFVNASVLAEDRAGQRVGARGVAELQGLVHLRHGLPQLCHVFVGLAVCGRERRGGAVGGGGAEGRGGEA